MLQKRNCATTGEVTRATTSAATCPRGTPEVRPAANPTERKASVVSSPAPSTLNQYNASNQLSREQQLAERRKLLAERARAAQNANGNAGAQNANAGSDTSDRVETSAGLLLADNE